MADSCEHGGESWGSINCSECLDKPVSQVILLDIDTRLHGNRTQGTTV